MSRKASTVMRVRVGEDGDGDEDEDEDEIEWYIQNAFPPPICSVKYTTLLQKAHISFLVMFH